MMRTAYFTNAIFRDHDNGTGHPESPQRLEAIDAALRREALWDRLLKPSFGPATQEQLRLCHDEALIERIRELAQRGGGAIDPDTRVSPTSFEVVCHAVGAAIRAADGVLCGEWENAFVASRPPGHHATPSRAMGFCLFNSVAVAAREAQRVHGLERVAILDFDVHHGNGTQEIFYEDGSVFYASVHQSPFFPGTGSTDQRGAGAGEGCTFNIPLPAGQGDAEYLRAWREIGAAVKAFQPELILLSAGYDAHYDDPLGGMKVTRDGFAALTQSALDWARELCAGRLVCVLEGGYSLGGLSQSVAATMEVLSGDAGDLVLLFDENLMTAKRVILQLERGGYRVNGYKDFPERPLDESPQIVLINLGTRAFEDGKLIERCRLRFPEARIIGFCGHREVELRRAAKAAGIDKLLNNEVALAEIIAHL
jgi:acetoin utilization deacetylase AcuC-like enzyme